MKPFYDKDGITVYCGDMLDVLPQLEPNIIDAVVTDPPYGLSFMGKDWDHGVPGPSYWQAVLRVAKPGAPMLAFGGTRTFHRLTCAIEDAGWEIRDCLMWLYGSGFPKSLDIAKAIDKQAGAERTLRVNERWAERYPNGPGGNLSGDDRSAHYNQAKRIVGNPLMTSDPVTELAQQWNGWGTALKPAWEPIVAGMKPLDGTFARNAQEWGVAGYNINASRIPIGDEVIHAPQSDPSKRSGVVGTDLGITGADKDKFQAAQRESIQRTVEMGRWPANLLLDEEAAGVLDAQSLAHGIHGAGKARENYCDTGGTSWFTEQNGMAVNGMRYGDSGGAARFFYCAKTSKRERGEGNDHPTVKPLALMKYLLTLVDTPIGALFLDPCGGSGSTAIAAKALGRRCITVELDPHYCEIIATRLEASNN